MGLVAVQSVVDLALLCTWFFNEALAFHFNRVLATLAWPFWEESCRGVNPAPLTLSTKQEALSSILTMSLLPVQAASCKAVLPNCRRNIINIIIIIIAPQCTESTHFVFGEKSSFREKLSNVFDVAALCSFDQLLRRVHSVDCRVSLNWSKQKLKLGVAGAHFVDGSNAWAGSERQDVRVTSWNVLCTSGYSLDRLTPYHNDH